MVSESHNATEHTRDPTNPTFTQPLFTHQYNTSVAPDELSSLEPRSDPVVLHTWGCQQLVMFWPTATYATNTETGYRQEGSR